MTVGCRARRSRPLRTRRTALALTLLPEDNQRLAEAAGTELHCRLTESLRGPARTRAERNARVVPPKESTPQWCPTSAEQVSWHRCR